MENKKINVSFYGGKSLFSKKEGRLIAEIITCDKCNICSLYKEGKCLKKTSPFGGYCKYGTKNRITGYTSRASKYYDFRRKYEKDEVFNNLKSVSSDRYIAEIGDELYLHLKYVSFDKENKKIKEPTFSKCQIFITKDDFDNEFIKRICIFDPHYILDYGVIKEYQEKFVPEFLYQLQKYLPEIYNNFINEYPEFKDKTPDHIGKKAYIYTLAKGCKVTINKNIFLFDGEYLICNDYKSYWLLDSTPAEVRVKVNKNLTCEITDNLQVTEQTIFK